MTANRTQTAQPNLDHFLQHPPETTVSANIYAHPRLTHCRGGACGDGSKRLPRVFRENGGQKAKTGQELLESEWKSENGELKMEN